MKKITRFCFVTTLCITLCACGLFGPSEEEKLAALQQHAALKAQPLKQFFEKYGKQTKDFAHDPKVIDWFSNHTERGKDLSEDSQYQQINQIFKNISEPSDEISSAFFGSAITGEYFREDEITGHNLNYYTYKRPWFSRAVEQGTQFRIHSSMFEPTTQTITSVIQAAIENSQGDVIGVAGIDLKLTSVVELIENTNYQGNGFAFLLDNNANIVAFPQNSITESFKIQTAKKNYDSKVLGDQDDNIVTEITNVITNHPVKDFDTHPQTQGFISLALMLDQGKPGTISVTFMAEKYYLAYQPINSVNPIMNWTLVIMVPESKMD